MNAVTSSRGAALFGARDAVGAAGIAMAATFLAFGAAVREAGLPPGWALVACWAIYGMPGQLVLVQAASTGFAGGLAPAVMGAIAVNARFLPMAIAITPLFGTTDRKRLIPAIPFIAVTPWAAAMRAFPEIAAQARLAWFLGFGLKGVGSVGVGFVGHGLGNWPQKDLVDRVLALIHPVVAQTLEKIEPGGVVPSGHLHPHHDPAHIGTMVSVVKHGNVPALPQ